jgi:hypothetical protein
MTAATLLGGIDDDTTRHAHHHRIRLRRSPRRRSPISWPRLRRSSRTWRRGPGFANRSRAGGFDILEDSLIDRSIAWARTNMTL